MPKTGREHLDVGLVAFSRNAARVMANRAIKSDSELWRMLNRKAAEPISRKTVNNALQGRHDAQISTLEAIAEALDTPLWVLCIPELKDDDLESPFRERLVALVRNYLQCDKADRVHAENMAASFAAKHKKP